MGELDERKHRQLMHEWLPRATEKSDGYMTAADKAALEDLKDRVEELEEQIEALRKELERVSAAREEIIKAFMRMRVGPYYAQQTGGVGQGSITTSGLTMSSGKMLGRTASGTGAIQELDIQFGNYNSGAPTATGYIEMRIGSTTYKLLASTS